MHPGAYTAFLNEENRRIKEWERKFDEEHDNFRVRLAHALICFERAFISHSISIQRLLVDSREKKPETIVMGRIVRIVSQPDFKAKKALGLSK